jgi:hypothetical protein
MTHGIQIHVSLLNEGTGALAMKAKSPKIQLDAFLAKYNSEIVALARVVLRKMRARLPDAVQLVYDNYNALVVGFGPTERVSEVVFSIALYPRWINLFFLRGAGLPDPKRRLKGSGKVVRHIVLHDAEDLDDPAIEELIARALDRSKTPFTGPARLVIKSVSANQRPRRPAK